MAKITVCYECPDRKLGCHGSCQKYQDEKKAEEEKRIQWFTAKRGNKDAEDYEIRRCDKIKKSMRKR